MTNTTAMLEKDAWALLLVGHGAPPRGYSGEKVRRLKTLEAHRRRKGNQKAMSDEERILDAEIRAWPRTAETDPYQAGIERLATELRTQGATHLHVAYNEFCGPSVEDAIALMYAAGHRRIRVLPTMFTPGGVHSEEEIPEILVEARVQYPDLKLDYVWPFDLSRLASMMLGEAHADRTCAR
jgi:sirohydrochlorin cobaltochelatase